MKILYYVKIIAACVVLAGCEECMNSTECTAGYICMSGACVDQTNRSAGFDSWSGSSFGEGGVAIPDGGQDFGKTAFPYNNFRPISGGNSHTVRELDTDCNICK